MDLSKLLGSRDKLTEQIVLSKMLTVQRIPPDILPDYFVGDEEKLFSEMLQQWEKHGKIDTQYLREKHHLLFHEVLEREGSYSEATLETLHQHWMRRGIGKTLAQVGDCSDPQIALEELQGQIADIAFKRKTDDYKHHEETQHVLDICERGQKEERKTVGYSTGLASLDTLTSGIEKGKMYAIGALKKTGKSRFMTWLAMQINAQGGGVMVDSLEMTRTQLNSLALAYHSKIDSRNIGRRMPQRDFSNLAMGYGHLHDLMWCIYRDYTVPALKARILYEQTKRKIDVVFIDYIQRMRSPAHGAKRSAEVENIANGLADLSRDLNVAVIPLSQLSGSAEHLGDTMPDMKHFKESQAIAESADAILTLHNFKRSDNPFTEDGGYRFPEIHCRVEQRYDVSGTVVTFLGDLRTCRFKDAN